MAYGPTVKHRRLPFAVLLEFVFLRFCVEAIYIRPENVKPSYNFIIVGGGTAGAVLATRLSESANNSVLLIEAGGMPAWCTQVPGFAPLVQRTTMDWQLKSVAQTKCCKALYNGQVSLPRGKALGGSDILNNMLYTRPARGDLNRWSQLGNAGWSYQEMLPYFLKSESIEIEDLKSSSQHARDGPRKITRIGPTPFGETVLTAIHEANLPTTSDYNSGGPQQGFAYAQTTVFQAKRQSTFYTYLAPVAKRPNLEILFDTQATKIIFDANRKAVVVEYSNRALSTLPRVQVTKEIILSAGAFGSPLLLMMSGFGPSQTLNQVGLPTVVDMPAVGTHLRDHVMTDLLFSVNASFGLTSETTSTTGFNNAYSEYLESGTGPFATAGPVEIVGFTSSGLSPALTEPDLQLQFGTPTLYSPTNVLNLNIMPNYLPNTTGILAPDSTTFFATVSLLHPYSSGEIRPRSMNPFDFPVIEPKYLNNDTDVDVLLAGLKLSLKIIESNAMRQIGARVAERPLPGCEQFLFLSDEYLRCHIRTRTFSAHSPISSCRMGRSSSNSVVDAELRIHNTTAIRIVDASAFATHISGNPAALVVAMAEKAADLILAANPSTG